MVNLEYVQMAIRIEELLAGLTALTGDKDMTAHILKCSKTFASTLLVPNHVNHYQIIGERVKEDIRMYGCLKEMKWLVDDFAYDMLVYESNDKGNLIG